jgi:hypothetical protein
MKIKSLVKLFSVLVIVSISVSINPTPALADVAPPQKPPGSNPQPGEETTQVRMVAETVLLEVGATAPEGSLGQAKVTASFRMLNLGSEAESMGVLFPISANDGFFNYPELKNFQVWVDDRFTSYQRVELKDEFDDPIPWAEFQVTFPPGEEVTIDVAYTLDASGEYPYVTYAYLLTTGAGWQGSIGSADLTVRLPYDVTPGNVFLQDGAGWGSTTPGHIIDGREMRWHFEDFEPEYEHNLTICMVMPSAWEKVLRERDNVSRNPDDGEAWGRLGKIYKEISRLRRGLRYDPGGAALYPLAVEAYEKAVTLLPNDAWWHAGYADLLFNHFYWTTFFDDPTNLAEMVKTLEELNLSISLDPDNEVALALLEEISYAMPEAVARDGDGFILTLLTATPEFQPTDTPQVEPSPTVPAPTDTPALDPSLTIPAPTETPTVPTLTPEPEEAPPDDPPTNAPVVEPREEEDSGGLPFCGSILLLPLMGVVLVSKRLFSSHR